MVGRCGDKDGDGDEFAIHTSVAHIRPESDWDWDRGSGSGLRINGEEERGEFVSRLLSVVMSSWSWARSMTPKTPDKALCPWVPLGALGAWLPYSLGAGRSSRPQTPSPGRRNCGSTPASEIVPPFPLWAIGFMLPSANAAPTNRLRASFSLEFLGPRTCETESCIARCLSCCSAAAGCCFCAVCSAVAAAVAPCECGLPR